MMRNNGSHVKEEDHLGICFCCDISTSSPDENGQ